MKTRVAIIDDEGAVRELLSRYLQGVPQYEVVGQAGTGLEAMRLFKKTSPNLAVVDLFLSELCGQEVMLQARRELPEMRIVVFTGAWDASVLNNALRCEPNGMVHKSESLEILLLALQIVSGGGRFLSPKIDQFLRHSESEAAQVLSTREVEVTRLIAEGKSTKQIGVVLGVATRTVDNHRARLMRKLGVHNAASLTLVAIKRGILPTSSVPGELFHRPFSDTNATET
jgi:DNA-binding NarL/FixJ family response regulator